MITGGQKPKRNQPCPCGSELKYKYCHGDELKLALANDHRNRFMAHLIIEEKMKRGLIKQIQDTQDLCPEPESNLIIKP